MKAFYVDRPQWRRGDAPGTVDLTADWYVCYDKFQLWIPAGYECDGASIPRFLWSVTGSPYDPLNIEAAFIHDALYLTHAFTREVADEIAFQIWMQSGLPKWKARNRWAAVRSFGYFSWKNTEKDKQDLKAMKEILVNRNDVDKFTTLWFTPGK